MKMFESDILACWDPVTDKAMSSLDHIVEFSEYGGIHQNLKVLTGHNAEKNKWWYVEVGDNITSVDMIVDDTGDYYCSMRDNGTLCKISSQTHKKLWEVNTNTVLNSVNIGYVCFDVSQENIYLCATPNATFPYNLWKIKTSDGSIVYRKKIGSDEGSFSAYAVSVDLSTDNVAIGLLTTFMSSCNSVYVLNSGGSQLWKANPETRCTALDFDSNGNLYAGFSTVLGPIPEHPDYHIHGYGPAGNEINKWALGTGTGTTDLVYGLKIRHSDNTKIIIAGDCYCYDSTDNEIWSTSITQNAYRIYFHEDCFFCSHGWTQKRKVSDGSLVAQHSAVYCRAIALSKKVVGLVSPATLSYGFLGGKLHDTGRDCGCFLSYKIEPFLSNEYARPGQPDTDYYVGDIRVIPVHETYGSSDEQIIGCFKCHTDYTFTSGDDDLCPSDNWRRLSKAVSRPFTQWWLWLAEYNIGDKVYHTADNKYYECNTKHTYEDIETYEPPSAYWDEVTAPDPIWSDYNTAGSNGEFDTELATPFYYTMVVSGFTGDFEYLNSGYHLQHVTDDFDGMWRFEKYNPDGLTIEINFELCNDSEDTKIEIKTFDYSNIDDWADDKEYFVGDRVNHEGVCYECILGYSPPASWEPPHSTYWEVIETGEAYLYEDDSNYGCSYELHVKTDDGNPGESRSAGSGIVSVYPGDIKLWVAGQSYSAGDVVVYDVDGRFYRSDIDNNTFTPPASWTLLS